MGNSRFNPSAWAGYQSTTAQKSTAQIFTSSGLDPALDPAKITMRESVDSDNNPNSTPIIVAVDVTGSMGVLADTIVRHGLGVIMQEVYDRQPIPDPHLMIMAIGDAYTDHAPLQVTQFEPEGTTLAAQVEKIFIEGNGGGNRGESYSLAYYFAAFNIVADAIRKRKRKGYLFTIGDEAIHPVLTKNQIRQIFGANATAESDLNTDDLYQIVARDWEVFHLIVAPKYPAATSSWKALLGERAVPVTDHEKLAEVIVSLIQVNEGHDVQSVVGSWSGNTAVVVAEATRAMTKGGSNNPGVWL